MGTLFKKIQVAISNERYLVSSHADERCEERGISDWQIIAGFSDSELLRERPASKPNPSVVVRQELADGTEVEAIWAYLADSGRAMLVTVYFTE
ncbi:MAG TPA: DUF4258 domain-containing protein [Pirellulales bacterium]|nr:DUF4258 domain-containing protein [Pirellulales bacterium]